MRKVIRDDGYTVCDDGTVYSTSGKVLAVVDNRYGYKRVTMPGQVLAYVHILVAEAFVPNPENKPCVNHIDGVKSHNFATNLEWATHSENQQHAFDTGLQPSRKGDKNGRSKLSDAEVQTILKEYPERYKGWAKDTAAKYGVHPTTISHIVRGKNHAR
jgi:hypothetical protein